MQPFSYNTPERPTTEHLVSRVQSDHHGTREANCRSALHPRRVTITIITTRLATANRSRASAVVIDRAKIFLTSSMISMQNLVVVSHTVCAHVGPFFFWGGGGGAPWNRRRRWSCGHHATSACLKRFCSQRTSAISALDVHDDALYKFTFYLLTPSYVLSYQISSL